MTGGCGTRHGPSRHAHRPRWSHDPRPADVLLLRRRGHQPLQVGHDVFREVDGLLFLVVQGAALVDGAEDAQVGGVDAHVVRIAEDGDELVSEDFYF